MTTPKRRQTHQVKIDHLIIGSDAPVLVQSMTNTDKAAVEATMPLLPMPASVRPRWSG